MRTSTWYSPGSEPVRAGSGCGHYGTLTQEHCASNAFTGREAQWLTDPLLALHCCPRTSNAAMTARPYCMTTSAPIECPSADRLRRQYPESLQAHGCKYAHAKDMEANLDHAVSGRTDRGRRTAGDRAADQVAAADRRGRDRSWHRRGSSRAGMGAAGRGARLSGNARPGLPVLPRRTRAELRRSCAAARSASGSARWAVTIVLALAVTFLLRTTGLVNAPVMIATALATTRGRRPVADLARFR